MANATSTKTKKESLQELRNEVALLRSFVIGLVGKDEEGEYRPEFVRRILKAAKEKPTRTFRNAKSFLAELKKISCQASLKTAGKTC